jgi:putative PIN family toxin of toxin-antitoxin system
VTLRVVLDTNVVVSALVFQHGRLAWIRTAWMVGRCTPLGSGATIDEIIRVLTYPKLQLTSDDVEVLLADYLPFVQVLETQAGRPTVPEPADPDDRMFLELAEAGHAQFLITGDRDLLRLSCVGNCRIIAPAELGAILEGAGGSG